MTADILRFFAKSADKAPGKGAGEQVADASRYRALAGRPNWRQVLSNFHECPFVHKGRTYRTIEHAFQAAKIALENPAAAHAFTVESGTELGTRGDGLAARRQRKMVVLRPTTLAAWDAMSMEVMAVIAAAKYAQCAEARHVLADTGDAQLWHAAPRMQPVRFVHLESIRAGMRR